MTVQRIIKSRALCNLQWTAGRQASLRMNVRAMHNVVRRSAMARSLGYHSSNNSTTITGFLSPVLTNQRVQIRSYTTDNKDIVDFEFVQRIVKENDTEYTLLDVREPSEVLQGKIPTAINIPLSKMLPAWTMSPEEFEEEFGFERPKEDDKIIVYCQAGIRSNNAADFLREIGYKSVMNYPGSYGDYVHKSSQA
ncbi:Rhodanese-like domain-containing protein [Phascolomyces articulosus]|uniref:Rhodanese-like domain-containing protein n=1 Tax=Phascolomyces articulosus TaxID=60185 RepID=A0AAD5KQ56_9FUNG|nr:Rhodanese-like domain-containing protein [Phascolomyces articulosus]